MQKKVLCSLIILTIWILTPPQSYANTDRNSSISSAFINKILLETDKGTLTKNQTIALLEIIQKQDSNKIPTVYLEQKIFEGINKKIPPKTIIKVTQKIANELTYTRNLLFKYSYNTTDKDIIRGTQSFQMGATKKQMKTFFETYKNTNSYILTNTFIIYIQLVDENVSKSNIDSFISTIIKQNSYVKTWKEAPQLYILAKRKNINQDFFFKKVLFAIKNKTSPNKLATTLNLSKVRNLQ